MMNFQVEVTDFYSDRLSIKQKYMKLFEDPHVPVETKHFLKEKLQSIKWLMKNLDQRNSTLRKIVEELVKIDREFFIQPNGPIAPMTLKRMGELVELHESTIARAISHKYLSCDRGVFSIKDFFSKGYRTKEGDYLSSKSIQEKIKRLMVKKKEINPFPMKKFLIYWKEMESPVPVGP